MLSNAGVHDGFDETNYIDSLHLFMDVDPRVVRGVLNELKRLVAPERRDEQIVAAKAPVREPIVPPVHGKSATPPAKLLSAATRPPIAPDVTCTKCWGLVQSLGSPGPDPWMR